MLVESIQLDVTSYCNAKCGSCGRNRDGGDIQPWLELTHLDVEFWDRFLSGLDKEKYQIKRLHFNGNWGDAILHPQLIDVIKIFRKHYPKSIVTIPTNGSARSLEWWEELASVLDNSEYYSEVQFAIDGLEDTHSIYRRNTDYNKIINNIKTFVNAGGIAQAVITVFDHNIHQVDDIVQIARDIGCANVFIRPSHEDVMHIRTETENYDITAELARLTVTDKNWKYNNVLNRSYWLKDLNTILKRGSELSLTHVDSKCPWIERVSIQIDSWGNVWPCCHIGNRAIHAGFKDAAEYKELYGTNNLNNYSLDEILANNWFTKSLPQSLESNPWTVCKQICGVK